MSDSTIELPEILNVPPKCLPVLLEFNDWSEFLLEGGRGSGKTQSVARILLYICERRLVRVFCGRETQANIDDSVYTVLTDLIRDYDLDFDVKRDKITHRVTGSTFKFRGFREQNRSGVKGIEGTDILWIDEAQEITKDTLDVIMPTVRKAGSRVIFTMNRHVREDAVYMYATSSDVCKHIKVNYYDNPYLTESLRRQAAKTKERSERDYNHIWLGEPLAQSDDFVFPSNLLERACYLDTFGTPAQRQVVAGIDVAAQGNDLCVVTIMERVSHRHFSVAAVESWDYKEPAESIGRIVELLGRYKPDIAMLDVDGLGSTMASRIREVMGMGCALHDFSGASTDGIDKKRYRNKRAAGYFHLLSMLEDSILKLNKERDRQCIYELERIKFKYLSNGRRQIWSKQELKAGKEIGHSPDFADSMMMAGWATKLLGNVGGVGYNGGVGSQSIRLRSKPRVRR